MKKSNKNKIRITITIMPILNKTLDDLSLHTDQSKSSLIEQAIAQFLKARLDNHSKKLAQMNFNDLPTEEDWLILQQ